MAAKPCVPRLWYVLMVLGVVKLSSAAEFTHWLVTEEGKIEFQVGLT